MFTASCVLSLHVKPATLDVTRRVLDNGLTLLTLEKHDVPIVTSTIWYHVGSADESKGQTGISHFLEHLMFKGTQTYGKGGIDSLTAAYGGHNNAGTIFDYTMYYFNFSSDRWELALEIEADRMQHCVFEPDEFEAERNVVLEELKQQKDSPWGELAIQLEAVMFPEHPYHHPVIGWQEDLEQLPRQAVIDYYNTYYVPNNATIVVVGDVETSQVIELVQQYFAHIPSHPNLPVLRSETPQQEEERRFTLYQDTSLKRLQIGYHGATLADKDTYALDILDHILSQGKTSRLYQRLIEQERLVNFIDTYNHARKFSGVLYFFATLRSGVPIQAVEVALDEELSRLHTELVSEEEMQKARNVIAADFIFEKETASGLAHALGEYEVLHSYEYMNTYTEGIEQVTPGDLIRVAQKYLVPQNRTVGWAIPQHPEQEQVDDIGPEAFLPPPATNMVFHTSAGEENLPGKGESGPAPIIKAPEVFSRHSHQFPHHRWTLENGLTVLFLEHHVLPVVSIEAFVDAGQRYETDDQAGVAVLTGQLLDEGTSSRSGFEIARAIESVGGSLEAQSHGASVQVLSKDTELAMDVLSDILLHPVFDGQQLEKKRQRILGSLEGDEDNLALVAYKLFREMVYGSHPYHRPGKGYKETLCHLTKADVVAHYSSHFSPNNTILTIVGNVESARMYDNVQRYFGGWGYRERPSQQEFTIPKAEGCVRRHIVRDKEQVHLYLGHLGITRTNPDFYTLFLMDHILGLGAGFTDRVSRKLRDEQGLAYTVAANISLSAEKEPGMFMAYIGTSPGNVERSIEGFLEEMRRIRNELVLEEELELVKNYISGSYVFNFETSSQLTRYLVNVERYQLGDDFIWDFPHLIMGITIDEIQRVARQYLDPDNYYIASAGKM